VFNSNIQDILDKSAEAATYEYSKEYSIPDTAIQELFQRLDMLIEVLSEMTKIQKRMLETLQNESDIHIHWSRMKEA